jgi:uncharacterized protein YjbJ (UPF0337 family)
MKKIVRLTESDLTKLVERVISENERVYNQGEINKLYSDVSDDEDVQLDDSSGELSGKITKKIDIVKDKLKTAMRKKDWNEVANTLLYLDLKF